MVLLVSSVLPVFINGIEAMLKGIAVDEMLLLKDLLSKAEEEVVFEDITVSEKDVKLVGNSGEAVLIVDRRGDTDDVELVREGRLVPVLVLFESDEEAPAAGIVLVDGACVVNISKSLQRARQFANISAEDSLQYSQLQQSQCWWTCSMSQLEGIVSLVSGQ